MPRQLALAQVVHERRIGEHAGIEDVAPRVNGFVERVLAEELKARRHVPTFITYRAHKPQQAQVSVIETREDLWAIQCSAV